MIAIQKFWKRRCGPIGIDLGTRSIKLVQLDNDRKRVLMAARWELPAEELLKSPEERRPAILDGLRQLLGSHSFRGQDAVLCLGSQKLFVQNIRVPKAATAEMTKVVQQEAAARVPYSVADTEIRFLEAADIRQGDTTKREVILLACHRPVLDDMLSLISEAGLQPVAVDVEPAALLRAYNNGQRRDDDKEQRSMYVHIGAVDTAVVIAQGTDTLFVKYLDIGGQQLDQAIATHLDMAPDAAALLRRHNGDRRADQQDPEVTRGVAHAIRPVMDRLINELSLCVRYHSVTFRGMPLVRMIVGGGEASDSIVEVIGSRLDIKCELGDPLRGIDHEHLAGRASQWDVATGLALRQTD